MILYSEFAPLAHLSPFIECIWKLKSHARHFNQRELIIPGGRIEMIFNFGDIVNWIDSQNNASMKSAMGAYLLGPRYRPFFVEHEGDVHLLGVRFRHGGFAALTKMPLTTLMNVLVSADHVFGNEINSLASRLTACDEEAPMIVLIEDFLTKRIAHDAEIQQSLKLISSVKNTATICSNVDTISEHTGIHYKKLERIFTRYTGYNPKSFSRVIRFYKAAKQLRQDSSALTGIGLNNGYYDQPHFIRDFKAFTGKCPTRFTTENPTIANLLLQSRHV